MLYDEKGKWTAVERFVRVAGPWGRVLMEEILGMVRLAKIVISKNTLVQIQFEFISLLKGQSFPVLMVCSG